MLLSVSKSHQGLEWKNWSSTSIGTQPMSITSLTDAKMWNMQRSYQKMQKPLIYQIWLQFSILVIHGESEMSYRIGSWLVATNQEPMLAPQWLSWFLIIKVTKLLSKMLRNWTIEYHPTPPCTSLGVDRDLPSCKILLWTRHYFKCMNELFLLVSLPALDKLFRNLSTGTLKSEFTFIVDNVTMVWWNNHPVPSFKCAWCNCWGSYSLIRSLKYLSQDTIASVTL